MSLEFTLTESTSRFTRDTSPFRQASNSSRKAPLLAQPPGGLVLAESGLEPPVVLGELALLVLVLLLLVLLALRSGAGEEAALASASPAPSCSPPAGGDMFPTPAPGGDPGGVRELEVMRGGEDKFWCCCWEARRDVAIFTTVPLLATKTTSSEGELPGSVGANFRFQIAFGAMANTEG